MSSNPSSLPLVGADTGGPSSANGSGPARYDTLAPSASSASNRADRRPSQQPSNASPRHPSSRHDDDGPRADDRSAYADKGVPTSKIYIGGLPTDTEYADLDACFGKSGKIINIELKAGFGFVEFEHKYEADNAVKTYHNGFFMGSQIKVEHSKGGGRTAKVQSGSTSPVNRRSSASSTYRDLPPSARDGPGGPPSSSYRDGPPSSRSDSGYRAPYDGYRGSDRAPSPPARSLNERDRGYGPPPPSSRAPYDAYGDRGPPPPTSYAAGGRPRDYGPPARDDRGYYPPAPPPSSTGSRDYYSSAPLPPPSAGRYDDDRRDYRGPPAPSAAALPASAGRGYADDRDRLPPPPPPSASYRDDPPRRDFYSSAPPPLPPVSASGGGYAAGGYRAPLPVAAPVLAPLARQDNYYGSVGAPPPRAYGGGGGAPAPYDRFAGRAPLGGRPVSPPIGRYGAPGGDRDAPGGGGVPNEWDHRIGRRAPSPPRGRSGPDFDAARYGLPTPAPYASDLYAPANTNATRRRSLSPGRRYDSGAPGPPPNQGGPPAGNGSGYDSRGGYNGSGAAGGYGGRGVANGARY